MNISNKSNLSVELILEVLNPPRDIPSGFWGWTSPEKRQSKNCSWNKDYKEKFGSRYYCTKDELLDWKTPYFYYGEILI